MNAMTDTNTSGADVLAANEVLAYLPPAPAPKNGGGHNIDGTRILNQDGEGLDSEYSESELLRYGEACAKAAVAALIEREAALVAERDALKRMWEQAEADLTQADKDNAELIAKAEALAAEVEALRENLREVNGCTQPDCPHSGNYDYIDRASAATGGGNG